LGGFLLSGKILIVIGKALWWVARGLLGLGLLKIGGECVIMVESAPGGT
jgi:hypothetical protein